jgi:hypothetical protein
MSQFFSKKSTRSVPAIQTGHGVDVLHRVLPRGVSRLRWTSLALHLEWMKMWPRPEGRQAISQIKSERCSIERVFNSTSKRFLFLNISRSCASTIS